jgi:hypothetical protein
VTADKHDVPTSGASRTRTNGNNNLHAPTDIPRDQRRVSRPAYFSSVGFSQQVVQSHRVECSRT